MRVRVIRTVQVKPERFNDFLDVSLKGAEHVEKQTKIRPDVFWVRHGSDAPSDAKIFMDFDSMAQYEKLFLEGLLYDETYLTLAERTVDMIKQEPRDELLVLMDKDDFFMNVKTRAKREPANPARGATPLRRYRLARHVDVRAGKLRDFMVGSFQFMDNFERVANFRPELYCTRFTQERIGCSKMYFDYDECPQCETVLRQHAEVLMIRTSEVVEAIQPDELYVRVDAKALEISPVFARA